MKQNSLIKVIDTNSGEILSTFSMDKLSNAFEYAAQMESYGIDVKIDAPTITQTLADSLGLSIDLKADYEQSVIAELADHDGSCCTKTSSHN